MISKVVVRSPFIMNMWERHPKTWRILIDLGIFLKYKTLNINKIPNKIVLSSSNVLYVNSEENRGRALLISDGITQKRLSYFWSTSVKEFSPNLIIDVGVNYGECLFSTTYPVGAIIYGIEANHHLIQYIIKSREVHPNKTQITIINAFASDKNDEQKEFYIDKHWSGTSSASYIPAHNMIEKVPVRTITIDSIFKKGSTNGTVLFKVDVEGYEAFVLKGMSGLLESCKSAIGFIEFNSEYIEKSGMIVAAFFSFLQKYFTIYMYVADDILVRVDSIHYEDLQGILGTDNIHTDLLVVTDEENIEVFDFIIQDHHKKM
ncbi:FkbM family methyltransferase [Bacillus cihuensis]|uniref:FkbM family methyltransferase n=1 Tax=Bacillus cihuensis TaxID=1208599 RepID=UPI00048FA79F|nr:FkbM family methyltransferase [Bacillus cihuensis]